MTRSLRLLAGAGLPVILTAVLMLGVFPQWREYVAEVAGIATVGMVCRVIARVVAARFPRVGHPSASAFDAARRIPALVATSSARRARAAWLIASPDDRVAAAEIAATISQALPTDRQRADDLESSIVSLAKSAISRGPVR